jgi:hypothetical protein
MISPTLRRRFFRPRPAAFLLNVRPPQRVGQSEAYEQPAGCVAYGLWQASGYASVVAPPQSDLAKT